MLRTFCRVKLHRLTVTDANLHYEGSITIDKKILKTAGLLAGELVQILNVDNGNRFETYIIEGDKPGEICINGAAARLAKKGDLIIVAAYALLDEKEIEKYQMRVVSFDENNHMVKVKGW